MKVFLTGKPGCGKSTVLMKVIKLLSEKKLKVGGFVNEKFGEIVKVTPENREGLPEEVVKDLKSGSGRN